MIGRVIKGLMLSMALASVASGQSVNNYYPAPTTYYHVKNCWYDLRTFNGGQSRVGMTFQENPAVSFYYYFSPTDPVQIQKANAIFGSLLGAEATGAVTYVYVIAVDPVNGSYWDFNGVQVGPN